MMKKYNNKNKFILPAPGDYHNDKRSQFETQNVPVYRPAITLSKKEVLISPGPANYDLSMAERPKYPAYKWGSSKRDGPKFFNFPGPATYECTSTNKNKAPSYS